MSGARGSVARGAALAAALGAVVPALALGALSMREARPHAHGGDWGALMYLYVGAGAYLVAFLLHPVFFRTRTYTGSFLVGVAFGAGGIAAVVVGGLALGELRAPRDAGAAAEEGLKGLAVLVAHGLLALPLAGLVRVVRGAPEEEVLSVEHAAPFSPLALAILSLALALGATGALILALFATDAHAATPMAWFFAATPYLAVLAVAAWRLRRRLVPHWRALTLGACFGVWVALLVIAWYVTETGPRDLEDWLAPLLVALAAPAVGAGVARLAARPRG